MTAKDFRSMNAEASPFIEILRKVFVEYYVGKKGEKFTKLQGTMKTSLYGLRK